MNIPGLLGEAAPRLADDAPALLSPTWLPPTGTGWPELDDLAEQHRRLLARRVEVYAERSALTDRFEAEDKARHEAQTAAFLADESDELPEVTSPQEREVALNAASNSTRALNAALDEFLRDAVALIEAHATDWIADLALRREAAAEQRREAERLLAVAREEEVRAARVEQWLQRNAGVHERTSFRTIPRMRFVTFESEEAYTPPREPEDNGYGELRPQLVDPPRLDHHPSTQPYRPSRRELRRAEELRTGGVPVSLMPDHTPTTEEDSAA